MTNEEREKLAALAREATPGPWKSATRHESGHRAVSWATVYTLDDGGINVADDLTARDARYIAAASPDVVLSLLSEIDRLSADPHREQRIVEREVAAHMRDADAETEALSARVAELTRDLAAARIDYAAAAVVRDLLLQKLATIREVAS